MEPLVLIHAASTMFMVGLIWFVQVVHYPLFVRVGPGAFPAYQKEHSRLTTLVVVPPMLLELGTGIWLVLDPPHFLAGPLPLFGLGLLLAVWVSTFALQVPAHGRLSSGFEAGAYRRLTLTNWVRTAAWSMRGILMVLMIAGAEP